MIVKRWMSKDFPKAKPSCTVRECLSKMRLYHTDACIVADDDDKFLGLVNKASLSQMNLEDPIEDAITFPDFYVRENDSVEEALLMFLENQEPFLPVVDENMKLSGVITLQDFLESMLEVTAMDEPGSKISLLLPDVPGSLKKVVNVLADNNMNILSVITIKEGENKRRVVIKVDSKNAEDVAKILEMYEIPYDYVVEEEGF